MEARKVDGIVVDLPLSCCGRHAGLRLNDNHYIVHEQDGVDALTDARNWILQQDFKTGGFRNSGD